MIDYEQAKEIAYEALGDMANNITAAFETEGAYFFDDPENMYAGGLPIAIRKSEGKPINCHAYMMQNNISFADLKKIKL